MELGNAYLIFIDAFPSDGNCTEMSRDSTCAAAEFLGLSEVVTRIDCDLGYLKLLSKLVCCNRVYAAMTNVSTDGCSLQSVPC